MRVKIDTKKIFDTIVSGGYLYSTNTRTQSNKHTYLASNFGFRFICLIDKKPKTKKRIENQCAKKEKKNAKLIYKCLMCVCFYPKRNTRI